MPKQKKAKDPNRPKRPLTAFMRYSSFRRPLIKEQHKDKSMIEISKIIGQEWKLLPENKKRPFHDEAAKDHETYRLAKEAYDKSKPKRPRTAYALFMKAIRSNVARENPGVGPRELMKHIAEKWKSLDLESKQKYSDMAKQDRKRWEKDRNSI